MWQDQEGRSQAILLQLFDWAGSFPPCRAVWCRGCYSESKYDPYPRMQGAEMELDNVGLDLLQEEQDLERYRSIRNGDHLMKVSFECNLCHFRNIIKKLFFAIFREPDPHRHNIDAKPPDIAVNIWRFCVDRNGDIYPSKSHT